MSKKKTNNKKKIRKKGNLNPTFSDIKQIFDDNINCRYNDLDDKYVWENFIRGSPRHCEWTANLLQISKNWGVAAIDKNAENKKFIFIDVYTDWCGWCKKMDASTFLDKEVVKYMNTHFYAVKMNAESKEPIAYKGQLYEYKQYNAKAGYNTLAVGLLDAKMSFPSFVVLNKNEVKKGKIMGYKDATTLLTLLKGYVGK